MLIFVRALSSLPFALGVVATVLGSFASVRPLVTPPIGKPPVLLVVVVPGGLVGPAGRLVVFLLVVVAPGGLVGPAGRLVVFLLVVVAPGGLVGPAGRLIVFLLVVVAPGGLVGPCLLYTSDAADEL